MGEGLLPSWSNCALLDIRAIRRALRTMARRVLTLEFTPRLTVGVVTTQMIAETAQSAGVSPDTLRYYEKLGLVEPTGRSAAGYRLYDPSITERVRFVRGAQQMGLRLAEIKELLDIRDQGACPCGHTRRLLERRLADVDEQRRRLDALRQDLTTMLAGLDECGEAPAGIWWCETEFTKKGGES